MKWNIPLLCLLVCIGGLWVAGQVQWVDSAYGYHPFKTDDGRTVYHGYLQTWLTPGDLSFTWIPHSDTGFDAGHFSTWRTQSKSGPFSRPSWDVLYQPEAHHYITVPFWLMALPPALLLSWRLWRRRKGRRQGFEVATA